MGAGHGHGHAGARHRWRLAVAFGLVAGFFVRRARRPAWRPDRSRCSPTRATWPPTSSRSAPRSSPPGSPPAPTRTGRRTYGSYRAEVFASGLPSCSCWAVSVYVVVEAVSAASARPSRSPRARCWSSARSGWSSTSSAWSCCAAAPRSRSTSRAPTSRWSPTPSAASASSPPGCSSRATGERAGGTPSSRSPSPSSSPSGPCVLGREVLAVLGQHAPAGIDARRGRRAWRASPACADVHDLHVWTLTSGMNVATAHLVLRIGADAQVVLDAAGRRAARGARRRARDPAGRGTARPGVPRGHLVSAPDAADTLAPAARPSWRRGRGTG